MAQKNAVFPRAFCLQCASTSSERVRIVFHGLCYIISAYNLELNANGILICILKLFMIRFFYATFPSIRGAFFLLLNLKPSVCSSQFSVHFFVRLIRGNDYSVDAISRVRAIFLLVISNFVLNYTRHHLFRHFAGIFNVNFTAKF